MAVFLNISLIVHSLFLILAVASLIAAQSPDNTGNTDFTWSADSPAACETYVTYRAYSPYSDIGSISDLFGISRMEIATATGLAFEDAPLVPGQLLLMPIKCTSNGSHYFSNVTYLIKGGDNFYSVSIRHFQNLTSYHTVEDMNPALKPTNLTIGVGVVFPLFCKCPSKSYTEKGIQFLLTYVWQPGDDVISVSDMFQASASDIVMENNRNFTAAIGLPVLIPVNSPIILQKFPSVAALGKTKRHRILIAVLGAVITFLIVSSGLATYFHHLHKKNKHLACCTSSLESSHLHPACKISKDVAFEPKTTVDKVLPGVSGYLGKPEIYDPQVIAKATMNLSGRFKLGGSMYRAIINDCVFAVKQTKDATEELKILHRVKHANLVKLMGISSDDDGNFYLVYEYAEKGSLDKWLFPKESSLDNVEPLSWNQRLSIALDVANGLQYLHEYTQPSIFHNGISKKNILLDSNFKAMISNFSTARSVITGSAILNADVFAFGVVLLQLLSGKRAIETKDDGEAVMLWKEINNILEVRDQRNERLRRWMDPNLRGCYPIGDAVSLAMLARTCTSVKSLERPRMAEVVFNLCILTQSCHHHLCDPDQLLISKHDSDEAFHVITPVSGR